MILQSQLFRGDPKLEAAAISDPAHILPGAWGPHVGKIQMALIQLDGANIAEYELQRQAYGASTAAAVLAYKRKRNIINFSYQTKADDIVGKMTIAALDREMKEREVVPSGPCRIVPIFPVQRPSRPIYFSPHTAGLLRLGFKVSIRWRASSNPPPDFQSFQTYKLAGECPFSRKYQNHTTPAGFSSLPGERGANINCRPNAPFSRCCYYRYRHCRGTGGVPFPQWARWSQNAENRKRPGRAS
jgi:hypothetical protein